MTKENELSVNPKNWGPKQGNKITSDNMHEVVDRTMMLHESFERGVAQYPGLKEQHPEIYKLADSIEADMNRLLQLAVMKMFEVKGE